MSEYQDIRYEVDDSVATITLSRAERLNAYTLRMADELIDAFDRVDADDAVRGVVVTGEGRAFCAGADLGLGGGSFDMSKIAEDLDGVPPDSGGVVVLRIRDCRKPVVAAINGPAVGVGLTMTLPMDVRLAVDGAKMAVPFTRRGISIDGCASWYLPRVVGVSTAMEWLTSGRTFLAEEALERGLVRSVHSDGPSVVVAATELVRSMTESSSPVSVAIARRLVHEALADGGPEAAHRRESLAMFERGRSADVREGVTAFLDKRDPTFPDLVSELGNLAD